MSSDWGKGINEILERDRAQRKKRKQEFKRHPPQAEIEVGEGVYKHKIGFWNVTGGIIKIIADKNGVYDPIDIVEIYENEVEVIKRVSRLPKLTGD